MKVVVLLTLILAAIGANAQEGVATDSFWYLKPNPLSSQGTIQAIPTASSGTNVTSETSGYRPFRIDRTRSRAARRKDDDLRKERRQLGQLSSPTADCESCRVSALSQPATLTTSADQTLSVGREASERVLDDALQRYEDSPQVARMIDKIREDSTLYRDSRRRVTGSKSSSRSIGRCLMYVKFAMLEADYFSSYPGGRFAANFGPALESRGFTNLMDDDGYNIDHPDDAPVGSVIVYEKTPGSRTPGHIEVKLGPNEYGSDYIADEPISDTTSRRRIIGIYAKVQ